MRIIQTMNGTKLFTPIWLALVLCGTAMAGDGHTPAPVVDKPIPWIAILYAVVFLLGIVVIAFKGTKRTHLD